MGCGTKQGPPKPTSFSFHVMTNSHPNESICHQGQRTTVKWEHLNWRCDISNGKEKPSAETFVEFKIIIFTAVRKSSNVKKKKVAFLFVCCLVKTLACENLAIKAVISRCFPIEKVGNIDTFYLWWEFLRISSFIKLYTRFS